MCAVVRCGEDTTMKIFRLAWGGIFAQAVVTPDGELTDVYVHPFIRKKGYAHEIMRMVIAYANRNKMTLRLRVQSYGKMRNRALYEFYARYGFKRINGSNWLRRTV